MHSIFTIITLISIATLTNVQLHFNIKLVGVFDYFTSMFLNGLRARINNELRTIEIHEINHNILSSRIPNYSFQVGDTITEINGRNTTRISATDVNRILSQEILYQIQTTSRNIPHDGNSQLQIRYDNGLEIRRSRNSRGRIEIHAINDAILRNLIPNYTCQVGDTLISINDINVVGMLCSQVKSILRSQILHSLSTQRGYSASLEQIAQTNAVGHTIPITNRSYNQLIQGIRVICKYLNNRNILYSY